jgi:hypothetical protein
MKTAKIYNDAQSMSDGIASEINMALKAGDGYSRAFYIPNKISRTFDFNTTVSDYRVILSWSGGSVQSIILAENVTGKFTRNTNLIKNINGKLYVNQ